MPASAPRRGAQCGSTAVRYRDALVGVELVVVPLCRLHFRKLLASPDPVALVRAWVPESAASSNADPPSAYDIGAPSTPAKVPAATTWSRDLRR
jgi:hypothetical protein